MGAKPIHGYERRHRADRALRRRRIGRVLRFSCSPFPLRLRQDPLAKCFFHNWHAKRQAPPCPIPNGRRLRLTTGGSLDRSAARLEGGHDLQSSRGWHQRHLRGPLRTRRDRIKLVLVRHEEALAACGYINSIGRLGSASPRLVRAASIFERVIRCQVRRPAGLGDHGAHVSRSHRHTLPTGCESGQTVQ